MSANLVPADAGIAATAHTVGIAVAPTQRGTRGGKFHLTTVERQFVDYWRSLGYTLREIAGAYGCAVHTVSYWIGLRYGRSEQARASA